MQADAHEAQTLVNEPGGGIMFGKQVWLLSDIIELLCMFPRGGFTWLNDKSDFPLD